MSKFIGKDERFFASITVTDTSSFLQVPKHKHMPSLPSMVFLEKEIKQMNGEIDEFEYSDEFVDALFDKSQDASYKDFHYKLDCLLAQQSWRKGLISEDMEVLKHKIYEMDEDSEDKDLFKYLLGQKLDGMYHYPERHFAQEEMMMEDGGDWMMDEMEAMPMMAPVAEFRGADGGGMMEKNVAPSPSPQRRGGAGGGAGGRGGQKSKETSDSKDKS
jgi:hypothetical protein